MNSEKKVLFYEKDSLKYKMVDDYKHMERTIYKNLAGYPKEII